MFSNPVYYTARFNLLATLKSVFFVHMVGQRHDVLKKQKWTLGSLDPNLCRQLGVKSTVLG